MAIYHATTKPISRKNGRTAIASAAYRSGQRIVDERTGKIHDYTKKGGVLLATAFDKDDNELDRNQLWNLAEESENRKDSRTAREWIVAIPSELMPEYPEKLTKSQEESMELLTDYKLRIEFAELYAKEFAGTQTALDFGKMLSKKYGVAVDVAIHAPDQEGSNKNYHAHIMTTTRKFSIEDGQMFLGDKSNIELSNKKLFELKQPKTQDQVKEIRKEWADIVNNHLEKAGLGERIDHRSYEEIGINKKPTIKMGYKATEMERAGKESDRGDINRAIKAENVKIKRLAFEIRVDKYDLEKQKAINEIEKNREEQIKQNHEPSRQELKDGKPDQVAQRVDPIPISTARTTENTDLKNQVLDDPQPQIEKVRQSEVATVTEPPPHVFEDNHKIFSEYSKRVETAANAILNSQLKVLQDEAKPARAKYIKLRDNEPVFIGKEKWQKNKQNALKAFNAIKIEHDTIKDKGITNEHREQVKARIAEHEPLYHAKAERALEILKELEKAEQNKTAKQHGADFHAQQYQIYSGKVLQVDRRGIVQQTRDGVVFHPDISSVEQGKSYNIERKGNMYEIQQQYEFKKSTKNQDKDMGIGR